VYSVGDVAPASCLRLFPNINPPNIAAISPSGTATPIPILAPVERPGAAVLVLAGVLADVEDELVWLSEAGPVPVPLVKVVV
jgi:hypothetical protein